MRDVKGLDAFRGPATGCGRVALEGVWEKQQGNNHKSLKDGFVLLAARSSCGCFWS